MFHAGIDYVGDFNRVGFQIFAHGLSADGRHCLAPLRFAFAFYIDPLDLISYIARDVSRFVVALCRSEGFRVQVVLVFDWNSGHDGDP